MLPDALGATWRRQCDAFQRVVGNAGDVILSGSAASRGGGSPRPALPLAARRPMAGTNDILNNVRDFVSLRAAMPHSPDPHKYLRTRIPPARPYLSGHVVVAACVPLPKADPAPSDQGRDSPAHRWRGCELRAGPSTAIAGRHAAQLLLGQADVAAVSHQVHLALFYDAQLDIKAMGG
jgi:hypothetical protein